MFCFCATGRPHGGSKAGFPEGLFKSCRAPAAFPEHLHDLDDPRVECTRKQPLINIISTAVRGVLSGANSFAAIRESGTDARRRIRAASRGAGRRRIERQLGMVGLGAPRTSRDGPAFSCQL